MKKIGLMGGTFDPIHLGHLMLGKQAYEEYKLDEIWYMPSRIPPHKKDHLITSAQERAAMIEEAIRPYPYFVLSDFEIRRTEGNTYTADTLRLLLEAYPEDVFYFIVGADSVYEIEKWYQPEYVLQHAVFLAADRDYENPACTLEEQIAYLTKKYDARIYRLHCQRMNASSVQIRNLLQSGSAAEHLIPKPVLDYIQKHGLYQEADDQK